MKQSEFIQKYGNFAQAAAKGSGISPLIILSQAFLESGAGESGLAKKFNNFFGIKADKNWQGKKVNLKTQEFINGKFVIILQPFRVYNSPSDSFADHIKFLKTNKRYAKAGLFTYPDNFAKQADTLQQAGYATDPQYADKLKTLSSNFSKVLSLIKPAVKPAAAALPLILAFILANKFI
jgi:flagellum-specific peptidoglycan hydrolase FlgJ